MGKRCRSLRPSLDQLDNRCLPSAFTLTQVSNAYGIDAITFRSASGAIVPGNGAGETIAIIEAYHDPSLESDLHVFDQANNLPDPQLTVINQAGSKTNSTWASEETLDVEWAHAIAPGANILVVEARSQTLAALMSALDAAREAPGVVAISMSWGFSEMADEALYDAHFTTPAGHEAITFVAASGDDGLKAGAEYPAASRDVLSIGGTTLSVDGDGNYLSETAWSGSGGGYSLYEAEPSYQDSVQSTGYRRTADVSFDANPSTGIQVYETPIHGGKGSWQTVGGTSFATPAWAALIAIADQGRALEGEDSLDGATQTLPTLYSLPLSDFHPATGNVLQTGLGSPNAPALVANLVASNITVPLSTASTGRAAVSHTAESTGKSSRHHDSVRLHVAVRFPPDDNNNMARPAIRLAVRHRSHRG
jgi:hypothetical protein